MFLTYTAFHPCMTCIVKLCLSYNSSEEDLQVGRLYLNYLLTVHLAKQKKGCIRAATQQYEASRQLKKKNSRKTEL